MKRPGSAWWRTYPRTRRHCPLRTCKPLQLYEIAPEGWDGPALRRQEAKADEGRLPVGLRRLLPWSTEAKPTETNLYWINPEVDLVAPLRRQMLRGYRPHPRLLSREIWKVQEKCYVGVYQSPHLAPLKGSIGVLGGVTGGTALRWPCYQSLFPQQEQMNYHS